MSTSAATATEGFQDHRVPMGIVRDTFALMRRNLYAYLRVPQLLVFSTIQPVIFVLMFRYVFGGAVQGSLPSGVTYVDYLMPGIFVQTVVFGSIAAAIGLAADIKSGLMERFHALPMSRAAVLTGRTSADLVRNAFVVVLMMVVGFLVGWRIHTNVFGLIAAGVMVLFFGYAMSWIFSTLGLAVGDPETAQAAAFPVLAPLVFASSAFVPVSSMPGWLQVVRGAPAGLRDGDGREGADARRSCGLEGRARARLGHRAVPRVLGDLGPAVPQGRLSDQAGGDRLHAALVRGTGRRGDRLRGGCDLRHVHAMVDAELVEEAAEGLGREVARRAWSIGAPARPTRRRVVCRDAEVETRADVVESPAVGVVQVERESLAGDALEERGDDPRHVIRGPDADRVADRDLVAP